MFLTYVYLKTSSHPPLVFIKQDPQEHQDLLVFQADMDKRERKEIRVLPVSRERQVIRVTLEFLDFL